MQVMSNKCEWKKIATISLFCLSYYDSERLRFNLNLLACYRIGTFRTRRMGPREWTCTSTVWIGSVFHTTIVIFIFCNPRVVVHNETSFRFTDMWHSLFICYASTSLTESIFGLWSIYTYKWTNIARINSETLTPEYITTLLQHWINDELVNYIWVLSEK